MDNYIYRKYDRQEYLKFIKYLLFFFIIDIVRIIQCPGVHIIKYLNNRYLDNREIRNQSIKIVFVEYSVVLIFIN